MCNCKSLGLVQHNASGIRDEFGDGHISLTGIYHLSIETSLFIVTNARRQLDRSPNPLLIQLEKGFQKKTNRCVYK